MGAGRERGAAAAPVGGARSEPGAVDSEPGAVDSEPDAVDDETDAVDSEPDAVGDETDAVDSEPDAVDDETDAVDGDRDVLGSTLGLARSGSGARNTRESVWLHGSALFLVTMRPASTWVSRGSARRTASTATAGATDS
jgi:hypothetical protein